MMNRALEIMVMMMSMTVAEAARAAEPALTCAATRTNTELVVKYRFVNTTAEPVFVIEHRAEAGAHVLVEAGVVTVARTVVRAPEHHKGSAPKLPPVRAVAPGEGVSGEIRVETPVREAHPYVAERYARRAKLDDVWCAVGWYPASANVPLMPVRIDGVPREVPSQLEVLDAQQIVRAKVAL